MLIGGIVIALPAAGLATGKLWCRLSIPAGSQARLSSILNLYPSTAAMRDLGEMYLNQTGSTVWVSLRRLEKENRINSAFESGCRTTMISAIEQTCRDDFRYRRIHCIDGWVLAQTELDLAALCTIS
jgi:hypothetical protein